MYSSNNSRSNEKKEKLEILEIELLFLPEVYNICDFFHHFNFSSNYLISIENIFILSDLIIHFYPVFL